MQDNRDIDALNTELDELRRENHRLSMDIKKLTRSLTLMQKQMERNKIASDAKDNVSKMIAKKRSELERYMNLLLDNCPDMILIFDRHERIVYCTASFLKLCGIAGLGIIRGAALRELLGTYTPVSFMEKLERVFKEVYEEKQTKDFVGTADFAKDGNTRSYSIQVSPMLDEDGVTEGAMIIFTDTTEIVRAQREAERANAAKSDFLATVSHEIRTPMNAIVGVSGMLKSSGLDAQQHRYLKNIQDSAHVLLNLINDILDFSKIEAGKLELVQDYFRLSGLLAHLRSMFELMFHQKELDMVCEFSKDLPAVIYGDDKRISQILTNILNNAFKYTKNGAVFFRVYPEAGRICFEVEDTGIGIRDEAMPRLFSAFEQIDLARNKGVIGTGLGLAITKRLCELMNGSIEVRSEYGKGSCFTVKLSLKEGSEADLPSDERKEAFEFSAKGAIALVVDDIAINLEVAAYMLDLFGIKADFAQSGQEAIDKAMNRRYDIIFMDHMMPEMDGIEATRILRAKGGYAAEVPIVALTANAVSSAVQRFFESGFNDFLSKPMDDAALAQCLLKWLPEGKISRDGLPE